MFTCVYVRNEHKKSSSDHEIIQLVEKPKLTTKVFLFFEQNIKKKGELWKFHKLNENRFIQEQRDFRESNPCFATFSRRRGKIKRTERRMEISFFMIRGRKRSQNKNINIILLTKSYKNEFFNNGKPAICEREINDIFFSFIYSHRKETVCKMRAVYSTKPNLEKWKQWRKNKHEKLSLNQINTTFRKSNDSEKCVLVISRQTNFKSIIEKWKAC